MNVLGVIPARYQSSRLPGKPLLDICGKPMIWWVYQQALRARSLEKVVVATDSQKIMDVCEQYHMEAIITSEQHRSGVDRVAEVSTKIDAERYMLIQGDEPMIEPDTIDKVYAYAKQVQEEAVVTLKAPIKNPVDVINATIIKIVTSLDNSILFASRSAIPYPKEAVDFLYYKTVGTYCYPKTVLARYDTLQAGPIEAIEEHDIIRLLEHGIKVKAYAHDTKTISVDTAKDLQRVIDIISNR